MGAVTPWAPARLELLERLYPSNVPLRDVIKRVGGTNSAVCGMARRLGLRRPADAPNLGHRKRMAAPTGMLPRHTLIELLGCEPQPRGALGMRIIRDGEATDETRPVYRPGIDERPQSIRWSRGWPKQERAA